jgi:hypothetical protein
MRLRNDTARKVGSSAGKHAIALAPAAAEGWAAITPRHARLRPSGRGAVPPWPQISVKSGAFSGPLKKFAFLS